MCGWGRTLIASAPAANSAGPISSRKMKGPTMRRAWKGSTRPTSNPPRSLRRAWITISIIASPPATAGGLSDVRGHDAKGQGGDVLHAAGDDVAFAVRDDAEAQQLLAQELVEGVHVRGDDAQHIVLASGNGGALHHFRPLCDGGLEDVQVLGRGQVQLDDGVDLEVQAQFSRVQQGDPLAD